jgi:hypothetical protein
MYRHRERRNKHVRLEKKANHNKQNKKLIGGTGYNIFTIKPYQQYIFDTTEKRVHISELRKDNSSMRAYDLPTIPQDWYHHHDKTRWSRSIKQTREMKNLRLNKQNDNNF